MLSKSPVKVFKVFYPIDDTLLSSVTLLGRFGVEVNDLEKCRHPQEDYFLVSKKHPIFAVADGVTLELDKNGRYPNPSGAGEAARIFCDTVVKEAEKLYHRLFLSAVRHIFRKANCAVGSYNRSKGRTKSTSNFWDFDLFAATAAFVIARGGQIYWASICDSYVMLFNKDGRCKFKSPEPWPDFREKLPTDWLKIPESQRKKILRRVYRNGVDPRGRRIGYGVVTGEKSAERYLNCGRLTAEEEDFCALFTDGFENYWTRRDFVKLFSTWPDNLENRIHKIVKVTSFSNPQSYGHEKSLIVIKF